MNRMSSSANDEITCKVCRWTYTASELSRLRHVDDVEGSYEVLRLRECRCGAVLARPIGLTREGRAALGEVG